LPLAALVRLLASVAISAEVLGGFGTSFLL